MLKAIVFDLDDTLIDWSHFEANWQEVEAPHLAHLHAHLTETIQPFGSLKAFQDVYFRSTKNAWANARTTLESPHLGKILVQCAVERGLPADKLDMDSCLDAYQWGKIEGTSTFPDVSDALALFRERGLRTGIVTNAFQPMRLRDVELEAHGLMPFFPECRFSAADVGKLKPHPDIFKAALNCLQLKPDEVVFVGDNPTADIAGAQGAGMRGILRRKKSRHVPKNGLVVPDAVINTLTEIPQFLDKWYPGWGQ